ncbi:MAG: S8 family serine peptidase [Pyrinomonadaceae bacterium]
MLTSPFARKVARFGYASRLLALCSLSLLLCAVLLPHASQGMRPPPPPQEEIPAESAPIRNKTIDAQTAFVPGEILVRFRAGVGAKKDARASSLTLSAAGGREIPARVERLDEVELVAGLRLARVAPAETLPALAAFRARGDVLYAEPNYRRYRTAVPDDPRYTELWGLHNTGQSSGLAGADIKAEQAWNTTTGSRDFVVAVIDEGIDVSHQDLAANIWRNPAEIPSNGRDDDGNGFVDDYHGYDFFHNDASVYDGPGTNTDNSTVDRHGTHVAGTIGAVGNNGTGVSGVNWQTSLMSLKFLGPEDGSSADAIRAYSYARMMRERWHSTGGAQGANIRVTNNSYGGGGFSQAEVDGIRALNDAGILFVAAAGNEAEDSDIMPGFPASYDLPNVVSVAALDRSNNLSTFSNRGARTVHLAAPGASILSTTPGNTYNYLSGTSMASPHVAGTAALVLAVHPEFSVTRLRAALLFGGEPQAFLDPFTTTGRRLNASGALDNATENDATAPAQLSDLRLAAQTGRFVTLNWTAPGDDGADTGRAALYEIRFTDQTTGASFLLAVQRPGAAGTPQSASVRVPYRHPAGAFSVRVIDNAGNASESSINVSVAEADVNPYTVATESPLPLSTGGERMNLNADDRINFIALPFSFPYYDQFFSNINVSTNGALYFSTSTPRNDAFNLRQALDGRHMIAGLWDDLDLRTCLRGDADVYIVRPPENDRIIFRWQGVRFTSSACPATPTGENPVNFEIELRRDGTVQMRYGENPRISPVVGIGGGDPEGYFISSHSTERDAAPINLTNAPAITYTLRRQPVVADLQLTGTAAPNPILVGENLTYNLGVTNRGPGRAAGVELTHTLTQQATLISCTSTKGACSASSNGKVSVALGLLESGESANITIIVKVAASPTSGPSIINSTTTITSSTSDPDQTNNTYNGFTQVIIPEPPPLPIGTVSTPTFSPDGGNYATTQNVTIKSATADASIANVAAGNRHTVVQLTDGKVYSWGGSSQGQLAFDPLPPGRIGPILFVSTARLINGITGTTALAAGDAHTLALRSDGLVFGWGFNIFQQIGTSKTSNYILSPEPVVGLTGATAIAANGHRSLALRSDGTVWQWGAGAGQDGPFSDGPTAPVSGLANITAIAAGYSHSMAVRNDGTVWTWGNNSDGQLGNGGTHNQSTPGEVGGLNNVATVAGGYGHSLALKRDGTVWAWGRGGGSNASNGLTPAQVNNLSNAVAIAAGFDFSMALKSDGTVWAWGSNSAGQLGNVTLSGGTTPVQVGDLSDVRSISAKAQSAFALKNDSTLWAWGNNGASQLGDGTTAQQNLPVPMTQLTGGVAIHYTTNGVDPTQRDPVIAAGASLAVGRDTILKARAWKQGWTPSGVKTAVYRVSGNPVASTVQFGAVNFTVSEGLARAEIIVTRDGDRTGTAIVEFKTVDDPAAIPCSVSNGAAYARCDYATTVDAIRFQPGESEKRISIPLIADAHAESDEIVQLLLHDSFGATLGAQSRATLTITNDPARTDSPITSSPFFVRMQYLDFLNREPEPDGLVAWLGVLERCPDVNNDPACDRLTVSASFFRSQEFQLKGYFVYLFYKVSLGRLPLYSEIIPDMRGVSGETADEVRAKRTAFADSWAQSAKFTDLYPATLTPAQYVDELLRTAGVTLTGAVTRETLIDDLQAGRRTRAEVLRSIVEHPAVDTREYNGAFVAMQYFGYLRRDPEAQGYRNWLNYLNANPADFRTMVKGFANSTEYRLRFGQP